MALLGLPVAGLMTAIAEPSFIELAARRAVQPNGHRAPRMPKRYNRPPIGAAERDGTRAIILPRVPPECPRCSNRCLKYDGREASCLLCGWGQLVQRP